METWIDKRLDIVASRCGLTPHQRVILARLIKGETAKEIARAIGIAPLTVAFHRKRICKRVGVRAGRLAYRILVEG